MFLDGMGDQLSRLQEKDDAGEGDHSEGDPLDGIEEGGVRKRLTEEGKEKLDDAGSGQGEGEYVAGVLAAWELAEEREGQERGGNCGVKSDGMETRRVGWNGKAPGKTGGEASVAAFGEVAEGEEDPGEGRTRGPGVEGVEEREVAETKIDRGCDEGEEDADGVERGHHKKNDRISEKAARIGDDQQETGEREGREEGEEAGVPELVGHEADCDGGAETKGEGSHESHGGEDAEGGKQEMAGVEEVGVHVRDVKAGEARRPTHWAVRRGAGEPVLRRRDLTVVL
jgi:hypothetical protein